MRKQISVYGKTVVAKFHCDSSAALHPATPLHAAIPDFLSNGEFHTNPLRCMNNFTKPSHSVSFCTVDIFSNKGFHCIILHQSHGILSIRNSHSNHKIIPYIFYCVWLYKMTFFHNFTSLALELTFL